MDGFSTLLAQWGVHLAWAQDIILDPEIAELWRMLPCDLRFLMVYFIYASILLYASSSVDESMSSDESSDPRPTTRPPLHRDEGVLTYHAPPHPSSIHCND